MQKVRINSTFYLVIAILSLFLLVLASFKSVHAASAPADAAPGSTLAQRVAQRKAERQLKINADDRQRLQDQCTSVQAKLRTLNDSYTNSSDNRSKVYHNVDATLWVVIGKLKIAGKDTFTLEQQRGEYAKKVKAFENQSAQFQQTIKDIEAMNCQADPVGFKALIDTARLYNAQVRSSFISIKSFVIDKVQPTISKHSNDLKPKTGTN